MIFPHKTSLSLHDIPVGSSREHFIYPIGIFKSTPEIPQFYLIFRSDYHEWIEREREREREMEGKECLEGRSGTDLSVEVGKGLVG